MRGKRIAGLTAFVSGSTTLISGEDGSIGDFHLGRDRIEWKPRLEEEVLRVDVLIRDPSRACRTTLHSALRDAAISGFQFCHVTLRFVPEPQPTLEQIMQNMQEEKPLGGWGLAGE